MGICSQLRVTRGMVSMIDFNSPRRTDSGTSGNRLPNTSYAVLGMLSFGDELSGYQLKKRADNLRFFYWSPAHSQIYAELRRLEKLGFVTHREVRQVRRPDKRVYRITSSGQEAFETWMNEAPVEPVSLKHSVVLRLFFGHAGDPQRLREVLSDYAEQMSEVIEDLQGISDEISESDQFFYPAVVAEWGIGYYEAERRAALTAIRRLDARPQSEPLDDEDADSA
jgi:DNA-binding PadR family transcriptional regulator